MLSEGAAPSSRAASSDPLNFGPLSTLLDASPDGILVVDQEGRCRYANPAACKILGRSTTQLWALDITCLFPESAPGPAGDMLAAAAHGRTASGSAALLRLDREEREIEYVVVPVQGNSIAGAAVIVRDVSEARRRVRNIEALQQIESSVAFGSSL